MLYEPQGILYAQPVSIDPPIDSSRNATRASGSGGKQDSQTMSAYRSSGVSPGQGRLRWGSIAADSFDTKKFAVCLLFNG
ncbi:MAG: hypothetical protein ACFCU8_16915 [Thermosynechococcaceae cyanobacterium]